MDLEGSVGNNQSSVGDGTKDVIRLGKTGEIIVGDAHGHFYEAVSRGNVYTASTALAGVTQAAGMISPVAAAATVFLGLFNPNSSPVNLVILRTKLWTVSGTPGGPWAWNVVAPNAGITAAGAQGINNKTLAAGGQAKVFANAATTGGLVAVMFRGIGGPAAITAGAGNNSVDEISDGDLIIPPGGAAFIAPTAAGTTHIAGASVSWEEVRIT